MMDTTTSRAPSGVVRPIGSPAIAARGLTKRFGRVHAVNDLTFEARPGCVTGFLGPNGAGKSTTMRMVLGLVRPTSGSATVLGMPYGSIERPATVVGAVLEVQSFHPLRTGRNHLRVLAAASGVPDVRVDEVLALVDLANAADRRAGSYSLGMRQRLGLAGALLGDPRVLILDEPANGLDPQGIRWLREFLRQFAANGNAVLVSSHLLSEMAQMADEVIVIDRGRLVRQGSLADLTAGHSSLHVAAVDRDALLEVLIGDGLDPRVEGDGYVLIGTDAAHVGGIVAAAGIALTHLSAREATLEDVFLELTEGAER